MYEDCIEKFNCNRYPNHCSQECYLASASCIPINPIDRIIEGPAGRDGLDGKDLEFKWIYTDTEIRLAVRVKGTETWYQSPSLIGPKGEQGDKGDDGDRGPQGLPGPKGAPGLNGINGVSPIIETKENANGFRVEITDAEGTKTLQLKHGISPDIVTSEDEEGFNVEITDSKGKESFKLKHGESSEIDVEEITDGHKVIIKDKNGTKEILVMDGKDAVSPVIDMSKEDGVITIRVEDAEGVKEESVRSVPEFIGTLENPVDFSDLCKDIEDKDEYTGFCIIGGYFKVTDRNHNDLGVKHWTEIFPGTSSITLNAAESLLVQYEYAKYTGDEYGEIRFGAVISDDLYVLRGVPSLGLIAGWRGGRIATSVDLYNDYYKKTETYSKGETDTKISETVANNLTNYYKKTETYSKGETETKIAEAVANIDIPDNSSIPKFVGTEENPIDFSNLFEGIGNAADGWYQGNRMGQCLLEGYVKVLGGSAMTIGEILQPPDVAMTVKDVLVHYTYVYIEGTPALIFQTMFSENFAIKFTAIAGVGYYGEREDVGVALNSNVLEKNVNNPFTPTLDYHPATKKYVDDALGNVEDLLKEV